MKIAVIGAKGLPPKQGGIEHYCAEVYPRMVAQGHKVDLFARASYTDSMWGDRYDYEGVNVISLPGLPMRGVDAFMTSALGTLAATSTKYDIVHFHALGPSLFSFLPHISPLTKVVVTCQGLDWQRAKWGGLSSRLIQMGERSAVRFADSIIVVSNALQTYFLQNYGRETVYIPNAPASYADSDPKFSYGKELGLERSSYILFLGRMVPEKRPDLLVEAFSKLNTKWKLVLAGGVSDTKLFTSQLLDNIAKNPNIIFAGELRGARLAEIVRGAGLFALPSDLEGLPLAMLEAMREGIPVLASDILPHQQLLSSGRGIMFDAGNVDSCVRCLDWLIQHPQERSEMAKNALSYVEQNYSWDRITSQTLRLYGLLNTPHSTEISETSESKQTGLSTVGKK